MRTSWGLSIWKNTWFLFKCRVTFRPRQFSKARFGTPALFILGLRCLAIPNTYKNSFRFSFRKRGLRRFVLYAIVLMFFVRTFQKNGRSHRTENTNFPKRRWARSKKVFLSSALLFSLVVRKNMFWELPDISLHETIRVFCSNAESHFGCAISRRLSLSLWLFTSWVWDVLRYRKLVKTAFDFFGNVVFVVLYCKQLFWCFSYKPSEKNGRSHRKENTNFPKWCWGRPKVFSSSRALLFSLVVNKKRVVRSSRD